MTEMGANSEENKQEGRNCKRKTKDKGTGALESFKTPLKTGFVCTVRYERTKDHIHRVKI